MTAGQPLDRVLARLEEDRPGAPEAGFLGMDLDPGAARLVLLPVPWEATTSYRDGTAGAPEAIRVASHQLDLEDPAFDRPYRAGIALLPADPALITLNAGARPAARRVIAALEQGRAAPADLAAVNAASAELNRRVHASAREHLAAGRRVGLVGGDHSCPLGLLRALAELHPEGFGVLHLDAHLDLRVAYEGFLWSHASIFHNALRDHPEIRCLVQVGIRDYSAAEARAQRALGPRGRLFSAHGLFRRQAAGQPFAATVAEILAALPERVYVSCDIDALDPPYCPHTGTPVPGGLSFAAVGYLLEELAGAREIIGFDLCEVAPGEGGDEWDANVGARTAVAGADLRGVFQGVAAGPGGSRRNRIRCSPRKLTGTPAPRGWS
jgi:agmatinase